ncbi:MAG: hypothetical protein COW00_05840 [Bdellovibrio sp. CG12_big_fil_rev_8_21_14_0_65_39_13]|nr:MAG: hypothetical protein COW78_18375 [Bdellovibrio sp. CG22_combo_CG10-13_8_21_14_all_39_27]PIQ60753.1 MAG: hypothetical protein COW00_05840 [Bdellovibrio sp. CG12_big_fil_rev_8_21_14_0_65_39_13]PIR36377.1 MAG: hypothetical protein COV37_03175 [Bdellovibrio sp. CG11_big_fil_rev_8_21_14_0_20_39_38]
MHLTKVDKIQVSNFRNLNSQVISFGKHINCIFGPNGNGKTNILEAVYFLCKRKSFRKKATYPQFLNIDGVEHKIIINGVFQDQDGSSQQITCTLDEDQTNWFLNSKPIRKRTILNCVFINPFDSYQFYNSSSFRRNLIDEFIGDLDENYAESLSRYNKYLKQRNKLLQVKPYEFQSQIKALDQSIVKDLVLLTDKRIEFVDLLNSQLGKTYKILFSEEIDLKIRIEHSYPNMDAEKILEIINSKLNRDIDAGLSLSGIHKDDTMLMFNGLSSADYCSLGQQKMAFLSMFFSFIELFGYKFETYPLVLLDDVSGELDSNRWGRLVDFLNERKFQVLITTANEKFRESLENIEGANKFYVHQGTIEI